MNFAGMLTVALTVDRFGSAALRGIAITAAA